MDLCVSNIAWKAEDERAAYRLLADAGVRHIELAPTRFWPDLRGITAAQVETVMAPLREHHLQPVAFQALLFGFPDFQILEPEKAAPCADYLRHVIDLAAAMGATALVFGSPKNRRRGELPADEARRRAVEFFAPLGAYAAARGVTVNVEPNPAAYGCDFLLTADEAAEVVRAVASPGVKLHADTGGWCMNGEDAEGNIRRHLDLVNHVHLSEPMLDTWSAPRVDHAVIAAALRRGGYRGCVSIEMKSTERGLAAVSEALAVARAHYA